MIDFVLTEQIQGFLHSPEKWGKNDAGDQVENLCFLPVFDSDRAQNNDPVMIMKPKISVSCCGWM